MGTKKIQIEAVFPFGICGIKFYKEIAAQALEGLAELESLSEKISFDVVDCAVPVKIDVLSDPPRRFKDIWASQHKSFAWEYKFLRLAVQVEIDTSREARKGVSSDGGKEKTVIMPVSVFVDEAVRTFEHRCRDLFLCLSIARPGTIRLQGGALYKNGKLYCKAAGVFNSSQEAVLYVREEVKWPEIKALPIQRVWDWMMKLNGFTQGIGEKKVGRAVAALSYLVMCDSLATDDLGVVWALMGLESVYCHGNSGVINQLFEKSQLLLGPIEKYKKSIQEMYGLRSRVVHGDIDLPVSYSHYDGHPQYDKFKLGTYRSALLAEGMLVATIQRLVEHNLSEVYFKYALDM